MRSATEVETNIVSVERVSEYIELKPEAPSEIKATQPAADWPQEGALSYRGISARYRENLDLVLKDVSFELKGGEKVGVCGRTGAGKSSLTMVRFSSPTASIPPLPPLEADPSCAESRAGAVPCCRA